MRYLFLFLLCLAVPCFGATIRVPQDRTTIQGAIDSAAEGDTIILSPGVYFENIKSLSGKNLTVTTDDPTSSTLRSQVIVDGSKVDAVWTFSGNETAFLLAGFTIRNGEQPGSGSGGGGVEGQNGVISIQYCIITANRGATGGGVAQCQGEISNSHIWGNQAALDGGGIFSCNGRILGNLIEYNKLSGQGGLLGAGIAYCHGEITGNTIQYNAHLRFYSPFKTSGPYIGIGGGGIARCDGIVSRNIFRGNRAQYGGSVLRCPNIKESVFYGEGEPYSGIYSSKITNCIMVGLTAGAGAGVAYSNIVNSTIWNTPLLLDGNSVINSIVAGSSVRVTISDTTTRQSVIEYSNITGWTGGGVGNHPLPPGFVDAAGGDFRLLPESPNIDAGKAIDGIETDHDGNPRPVKSAPWAERGDGSGTDIGAFEFQGLLAQAPAIANVLVGRVQQAPGDDINGDGLIDAADCVLNE